MRYWERKKDVGWEKWGRVRKEDVGWEKQGIGRGRRFWEGEVR